jgi:hypothetical protein
MFLLLIGYAVTPEHEGAEIMSSRMSRRFFVEQATAGVAALGTATSASAAQLVYRAADWKIAEFERLVKDAARVKQVFDATQIAEGRFLNAMKNSLNGLQFGFNVPVEQIKVVAAMHGPANLLNFDDYVWKKYRVGEWLKVEDPKTGVAAARNPFYTSKASAIVKGNGQDPNDEGSTFQDSSIQTLQGRGVQFLCCHTATEEQARVLIKQYALSGQPEEIVKGLFAHTLPGVLVVASMAAAIALLQSEGRYSYVAV